MEVKPKRVGVSTDGRSQWPRSSERDWLCCSATRTAASHPLEFIVRARYRHSTVASPAHLPSRNQAPYAARILARWTAFAGNRLRGQQQLGSPAPGSYVAGVDESRGHILGTLCSLMHIVRNFASRSFFLLDHRLYVELLLNF